MSSTYGEHLKLSLFGQSHGAAIGMTLDGIPAGLPVDLEQLQQFLQRRAPGQNDFSTPRREEDRPEFLSGLLDGYTCGAPIAAIIRNNNTRSGDYSNLKDCPRPGHADYTAQVRYGGYQDCSGGGHFSGRITAPLCVAGGLCKQWLEAKGIRIGAHIASIERAEDTPFDPLNPQLEAVCQDSPATTAAPLCVFCCRWLVPWGWMPPFRWRGGCPSVPSAPCGKKWNAWAVCSPVLQNAPSAARGN